MSSKASSNDMDESLDRELSAITPSMMQQGLVMKDEKAKESPNERETEVVNGKASGPYVVGEQEDDEMELATEPPKKRNCFEQFIHLVIPHGGMLSGIVNLASVTLGAGIMSIPAAFVTSGIIMAAIYLVVITGLTIYSIHLLIITEKKTGLHSFENMARGLLGRGGDIFVAILMWLLCFGGAVGYVIAVGNVVKALFDHEGVPAYLQSSNGNRCIVAGVWLLFMLPLSLPKEVNSLRYASAVGVVFIVFFVFCVIIHAGLYGLKNGIPKGLVLFSTGNKAISGLSNFMFAYLCQVNIFRITAEARRPTVGRLTMQATIACSVCGVMYFLTGLFGYFDFGSALTGNALSYYDPYRNPMFFVCFLGFIIKLTAAFSLNMLACRSAFFSLVNWDIPTMPYWKHTLVSVPFSVAALILGLFVPDISFVFGLVGGFCGGFIGFAFPAIFIMYAGNWTWKTAGPVQYLSTFFLLICGVIGIVWGTGSTIYDAVLKYSK